MRPGDYDAIALATLAALLAGPVCGRLARARWPQRCPRAALVLWQAVGLAGGLAAIGAALAAGLAPLGPLLPALQRAGSQGLGTLPPARLLLVTVGAALGCWLLGVLAVCCARVSRARRRHRAVLDVVGSSTTGRSPVVVLEAERPVAYCVPGMRPRVVVSRATLELLGPREVAAVLAHERAHARGHLHLVVQPFLAWQRTFPFLPTARRGSHAVGSLVEMLADDAAARAVDPHAVATALATLATRGCQPSPAGHHGAPADPDALAARLRRMLHPQAPPPTAARCLVYLAALSLIVVPTALLT